MDFKYNGIILGKKDVGETDRIYTILTLEEGKIKALGKGARRPNARLAGHLEPITYSEILIARSKGVGKLTSSITIENFSKIKSDLEFLKDVSYAFGVLDKIVLENENDPKIFELTRSYLSALEKLPENKKNGKKEILTLGFLFKLLNQSGYQIETGICINCGKKLVPDNNYFSSMDGGILCENCQKSKDRKILIEKESIKFLRIFQKNKIMSLMKLSASAERIGNLQAILEDFLQWIIK